MAGRFLDPTGAGLHGAQTMDVRFTLADGPVFHWDGVLWSSADAPDAAGALNRVKLPEPFRHQSIADCALHLLTDRGWDVARTEILDETGWPDEDIGEDCFFIEDDMANAL